jgi:multicomponent Na+:H+ antiporter subunit E
MKLIRRIVNGLWFAICFVQALVIANVQMVRVVLFRSIPDLTPDFITYPIAGLSTLEIVILSHCITLTPGTTSVEISKDRKHLLVHALDAGDPDAVRASIKKELETPLLAWTR